MSAHRVAAITRRLLQQFRRDRRTLALLFVAPIVILALLGYMIRGSSTAPAVPRSAIVYEGEQARVWVAGDGDTLALREIRVGRISDGMVEVLDGLSAGEKVVTSGTVFIDRAARAD